MKKKLFLIVPSGRTDNPVSAKKDVLHLKGVGHLKKIYCHSERSEESIIFQ
ncbi:MAG: hypothetical protein N2319_08750 [Candidatus Kapabacteria bacterium]|nr:hypothetical protein [Candidatus Kapabacteria bacterium]